MNIMQTKLDKILFQYYNGNIHNTHPRGFVSLRQFINAHKNPSEKMKLVFYRVNEAAVAGNKELKNKLKMKHLFFFTPSVIFGERRRYKDILKFTGLAQLDFDNVEKSVALKDYLFENYQEIICCYLSPSGKGVKALVKLPISKSINEFRKYYAGLAEEFEGIDGFDNAPKNVALPLFISMDEDILYRDTFIDWTKKGKVMKQEDYVNLNLEPPLYKDFSESGYGSEQYYEKITIDIFKKKISEIVDDDGHPRLRNACLVLGSRIGAGYVSYSDALAIAEYEVKTHSYLSKGIANYIKTVRWALNNGISNPKYYK